MKKPLKIVLLVLAAVLLVVISYLAYVLIDYHRLGDMDLEVDRQVSQPAQTGCEYHLLSYNIGFGAYEPDYGFFMDGGKESWAFSEKRLIANMENIAEFINSQNADICILQEVDQNATRTYHFDEREFLTEKLAGYSSVWAENWNSPFLFYPFIKPHGSTLAGIMTFSMPGIASALRISLPIETGLMKLVDLDRETGNVYKSINIIARRANQISTELKTELNRKLADFSSPTDTMEETFENREQIEISRYYERLPKPVIIATEEFLDHELVYKEGKDGVMKEI